MGFHMKAMRGHTSRERHGLVAKCTSFPLKPHQSCLTLIGHGRIRLKLCTFVNSCVSFVSCSGWAARFVSSSFTASKAKNNLKNLYLGIDWALGNCHEHGHVRSSIHSACKLMEAPFITRNNFSFFFFLSTPTSILTMYRVVLVALAMLLTSAQYAIAFKTPRLTSRDDADNKQEYKRHLMVDSSDKNEERGQVAKYFRGFIDEVEDKAPILQEPVGDRQLKKAYDDSFTPSGKKQASKFFNGDTFKTWSAQVTKDIEDQNARYSAILNKLDGILGRNRGNEMIHYGRKNKKTKKLADGLFQARIRKTLAALEEKAKPTSS
ncbi:hypothetical protein PsorP6_008076 [Peronosclerospora sorghi]|uniref:Uncharacterized protein n=1 Tax=Peronosclerospora sorghi TaxID=230839 RepID=A0ACC0W971_9STRA|nr:hypothetical protein PsorP6_008076 [Peronosclerospora sorghi]